MEFTVCELMKYPFLNRSRVMQQKIVGGGRPLVLKNLPMRKNSGDNSDGNFFNPVVFEKVQWLIRCDRRRRFFCWTCLLFMPPAATLRARANTSLPVLLEIAMKHELTEEHMEAAMKLQIFIMENFRTSVRVGDRTQHNFLVKRNREVLKRLVDAVCSAVAQKHSLGDGKYSCSLLTVDDCAKFLQFLREFDKVNSDLVDGAVDLLKRYPRVVNDLVDAITRVVKTAIKNETHQSTYVSVILSEHGAPQNGRSQISTVLRYIKRGKVCERFIGFSNVLGRNSEQDVTKLVLDTIEQYGVSDRFLALSLDGNVLPRQQLSNLIASIKIDYQYSYFVPWHSHGFGKALLQTLSVYEDCRLFLKKINAIENYFQNFKPRESLEIALLGKNPDLRNDKWYETAPFITFLAKYRTYFVEFFDNVIKNCKYWEADDITKVVAFRSFLQEALTVFLLQLFYRVFSDIFDETFNFAFGIQKDMHVFDNPRILAFKKHVGTLKFEHLWPDMLAEIDKEGHDSKLAIQMRNSSDVFSSLFQKILRHMYQELDIRCNYLSRLRFCDLLNSNSMGKFAFSPLLLLLLMTEHGPFFRERDLRSEVAALNSNSIFQKKTVHELLESFADLNLRNVFPQLYKLAEFILTLPFLPASQDKGTSKLKDISNCSYMPESTGIPSGEVSFLCIETELLRDVKNSALFYEDVLARFYEVNQSLLLVQV